MIPMHWRVRPTWYWLPVCELWVDLLCIFAWFIGAPVWLYFADKESGDLHGNWETKWFKVKTFKCFIEQRGLQIEIHWKENRLLKVSTEGTFACMWKGGWRFGLLGRNDWDSIHVVTLWAKEEPRHTKYYFPVR